MKRAQAFALVAKRGGTPRRGVTRGTAVLIVGELGWPLLDDGRPSNSLAQARSFKVPIASERQFLEWVGRAAPELEAKTYTAEELASVGKVPKEIVEELAIFGLIEPRGGRYGFRDLAATRQIAGLLACGTALSVITRSLSEIRKWLPNAGLSNLRLFPESSDRVLIEQMKGRTDKSGQFMLPIAQEDDDPDILFAKAQSAEEAGDMTSAERLYRRVMKIDPADPNAPFNVANVLRCTGRIIEAEAAYRAAVKADPSFAEAWYNLAEALDELGRTQDAVTCLERAIAADPAYADPVFNLAFCLQRLEQHVDAATWWRRYLEIDTTSPWAARAKRALKYCEMRIAGSR
jgi:tetratricopeptide (TPR) repeat protein